MQRKNAAERVPMEPSVFERATSLDMLRAGYARVARNNGCAGGDGVTVGLYGMGLEFRLRNLHEDLRGGTYKPGPVAVFEIDKPGRADKRMLRVPSVADRVAQTAAYLVLRDILEPEFEAFSFGYRPGMSVEMALRAVRELHAQGFDWVVDADIKAYFDTVPHLALLAALSRHVPERAFLGLVRLWLELSAFPDRGLPQGAPISPILANLYLDALDERVADLGYRMVRYADDFIILCRNEARAESALAELAAQLATMQLELHPEKTAIRAVDEGYAFLGTAIRGTTLARQADELDELDGIAEPDRDETSLAELDGRLGTKASRRISGVEVDPSGKVDAGDTERLDRPWAGSGETAYPGEGGEPALPNEAMAEGDWKRSRHVPYIVPLYLRTRGSRLETYQSGFAIMEREFPKGIIAPGTVDRIDIFPGTDITVDAMRRAAAEGVPVFLVDGRGTTQAALVPEDRQRSRLHLAQARHALSGSLALGLARQFVAGRIFNARRLLQRLRTRLDEETRKERTDLDATIERLDHHANRAFEFPRFTQVADVRGEEAAAARLYWPALSSLVKRGFAEDQFHRLRQPAGSAFNAVLNYTAHLLRRDIETLLVSRGVHTGIGVLHSVDDERSGCVFDLMEEFRAPIAEALAAQMLSTGELGAAHFDSFEEDGADGVRIVNGGGTKIVRAYERHMDHVVDLPDGLGKSNWRGVMDHQITRFIRHVLDIESYAPYEMDF